MRSFRKTTCEDGFVFGHHRRTGIDWSLQHRGSHLELFGLLVTVEVRIVGFELFKRVDESVDRFGERLSSFLLRLGLVRDCPIELSDSHEAEGFEDPCLSDGTQSLNPFDDGENPAPTAADGTPLSADG